MVTDGNPFLKRALVFFDELKNDNSPNASTLAKMTNCSRNTAQRTIYRLRDEYLVPFDYNNEKRGYYLKDKNYNFPTILPPGKDELTALLLSRSIISAIDDETINSILETLWHKFIVANKNINVELKEVAKVFSSDSTAIGDIADCGLLKLVSYAAIGESLVVKYKSPWRHSEIKTYLGKILRVHYSDGNLYVLFINQDGENRLFNAAFIKEIKVSEEIVKINNLKESGSENWLDGFGIWAGEELEDIEIKIASPASEYFASQRWQAEQVDRWQGDVLVRSFQSIISPELVRRILSLGKYIVDIKPLKLKEMVCEDAKKLLENL